MKPETIQNIMIFMNRVDLKGSEVQAFANCVNALQEELNKPVDNSKKEDKKQV